VQTATLEQIAERAEGAPGTVFHLAGPRERLFAALIDQAHEQLEEELAKAPGDDPLARIRRIVATLARIFLADREVYRQVLKQWPDGGTLLRSSPTRRSGTPSPRARQLACCGPEVDPGRVAAAILTGCFAYVQTYDSYGNLHCPQIPRPLLELGPLARTATKEQAADWERKTAELARYKLGRLTSDDADGYHRVQCPAAIGKIRCPLRPASMRLDRDRPEILQPCSSSATTASSPPGTPGKTKTSAAPPTACPPKPAAGAARRSPPPARPSPANTPEPATSTIGTGYRTPTAAARPQTAPDTHEATSRPRIAHNTATATITSRRRPECHTET
jgi:hypothetical protein